MASVTLTKLWVHDANDNSTYVELSYRESGETHSKPGEVRAYAGGRRRFISRAGDDRAATYECRLVAPADVQQLREWLGSTVLVRDAHGRRFWAVSGELEVTDWRGDERADLEIAFAKVTYDETV